MNHHTAESAYARVRQNEKLRPYTSLFCETDWDNLQEHIDWVCTAPESELLDWAQSFDTDYEESNETNE